MTEKAIGYIRVSSKGQAKDDKSSLKIQREDIEEFATSAGYGLDQIFEDQYSAFETDWQDRPGLSEAFHYLKQKGYTTLIYSTVPGKRLARNGVDGLVLVRDFRRAGITVMGTDGKSRSEDDLGTELGVYVEGRAGQDEIRDFSRRQRRTKRDHAETKNLPISQAPYGYEKSGGKYPLKKIPYQAEKVKEMYRRYSTGSVSIGALCDRLNSEGVPTPRAEKNGKAYKWSKTTVSRILSDSVYRGEYIYQKTERTANKVYELAPEERHITREVPRIVSDQIWNKVQKIKGHNKDRLRTATAKNDFPLRGRISCRNCGYALTRRLVTQPLADGSKKTYEYYVHNRNKEICTIGSLKSEQINAAAFESAYRFVQEPKEVQRRIDVMHDQAGEINAETERQIEAAESRLASERGKLEKFLRVSAGSASVETIQAMIDKSEDEVETPHAGDRRAKVYTRSSTGSRRVRHSGPTGAKRLFVSARLPRCV